MSVRSMTGFAQARRAIGQGEIVVSLKSVNHRGLDMHFHLPAELDAIENDIRGVIRSGVARGHVQVHVSLNRLESGAGAVNRALLDAYMRAFREASGMYRLDSKPDLNRALESTVLVCRSEWKYVAEMELDLEPELAPVPCFPDEINQVILNLVINSAHAIAEAPRAGQDKGLIRISSRRVDGAAQISVADSGCGIPEAIRSRVFDPFFTTKPVGKGTGQGLALAYAIITEHHGGTIALESEVGKGTTFTIRLPYPTPDPVSP